MNSTQVGATAETPGSAPRFGPSDYLAAQRTFLAWIRTGIALMGFGFVVARFGLFLQEFQIAQPNVPRHSSWLSLVFGMALIAIGVAVNLFSSWQHVGLVRGLNHGTHSYRRPSTLAITVALVLAAFGVALAIYLTLFRGAGWN
jgi:putative membrane protein